MAENRTQDAVHLEGDLVGDTCDCPVRVPHPCWLFWSQAAPEENLELPLHDFDEHLLGALRGGPRTGVLLGHGIHKGC